MTHWTSWSQKRRRSYRYDAAGRRVGMAVAGQVPVSYTHDDANRVTQVTQGTSSVSFGYDANGRRTALILPNGVTATYGYDGDSHVTSLTYQNGASQLGSLTYGYDNAGRMTQMGGSFARVGLPSAVSSATYDAADRLVAWGSSSSFSYDGNGNLITDETNMCVWKARNQLSSISGGATASFQYDPFGRRISKTVGGATTGFLYDGSTVVQELSGGGPTTNLLTGGVDQVFTRAGTSTHNFLSDSLGGTLALTDPNGAVTAQYTYDPSGNTSSTGAVNGNSFQYTGRENDGNALYYYRARYYSP